MRKAYGVESIRAADQIAQQTVSEATLIDRASSAVARRASAMLGATYGARVVVVSGSGHNGADALWAGVKLRGRGARVDVVVGSEPKDEHGAEPLRRLLASGSQAGVEAILDADLMIDGLTGVGFTGTLRQPEIAAAASAAPLVLSVDVPSGVDAQTGAVSGPAVRAQVTVTFGGLKPGLLLDPGAEYAGQIEVADVGLGRYLKEPDAWVFDAEDIADAIATPPHDSSKYTRGVVGVVAGSDRYTGAAVLACAGALRAGAGMVHLYSSQASVDVVRARWPEVVAFADADLDRLRHNDKVTAWVIGPGLGTDDDAREAVAAALGSDKPAIVDADALTIAADDLSILKRHARTIVTPHLGEFARLTDIQADEARADRLGTARRAAQQLGVTVLLKGTTTVIAEPGGRAYINPTGTPWLSTAGTGDVLSGAIGSMLAARMSASRAGAVAAWLHGLAGRLAADPSGEGSESPITAGDLLDAWPAAVRASR